MMTSLLRFSYLCLLFTCICRAETLQFSQLLINDPQACPSHIINDDYTQPIKPPIENLQPDNAVCDLSSNASSAQNQLFSFISYENAYKAIDVMAISYALLKTYKKYQAVYNGVGAEEEGWIRSMLTTVVNTIAPQVIIDLSKNGNFLLESASVLIETLVIKTSLQFILYAGHGDLVDLSKKVSRPILKTIF